MKKTFGVCIIGTGWGRYLGKHLRQLHDGPLYVCGREMKKTVRIGKALSAADCFLGWESAVRDPRVDAVVLALPHDVHECVALAALRSGKHVFVEKPIATSLKGVDAMISAAAASAVVLAVGENVPFRRDLQLAKSLLPQIGPIRAIHTTSLNRGTPSGWRCSQERMGGGILIDFGIHHVRAIRTLLGEPDQVHASIAPQVIRDMDGEDNVTVLLRGDHWQATLRLGWAADVGEYSEYLIIGERGAVKLQPDGRTVSLYPASGTWRSRLVSSLRPSWLQERLRHPEMGRQRIRVHGDVLGYRACLQQFLNLMNVGRVSIESAEEARRDLAVILEAYTSIETGAPVNITPIRAFAPSG